MCHIPSLQTTTTAKETVVTVGQFAHPVLHQQELIVSNATNRERMASIVDGREVRVVLLDISGRDRGLIAIHKDLEKLLSFVNATSVHQFKVDDILSANGVVIGPLNKRHNIQTAMERSSKSHPGKVVVKLTMPFSSIAAQCSTFEAAIDEIDSSLPSPPPTYVTNSNLLSTSNQSIRNQPNGNISKEVTSTSVVRLFSVSADVTFAHLANFCEQCGPVNHIQTEMSKEGKKIVFVELGVERSVAESFVKKWAKGCRINNTRCVIQMSIFKTIFKKTKEAKAEMVAYKAAKKKGL